ncbi:MAG: hypothetical protein EOM67_10805 [Spirochaetia bacterium]|nr:hypothetical protein [Spirochaetia bacterium]
MKKIIMVLLIGLIAGAIDLIPLLLVDAPLYNMLSIIAFWLVATYIIASTTLVKNTLLNGLVISILLMIPMALALSATNKQDFFPMMFMSIILGPVVGYANGKWAHKKNLQK